MKDAARLVLEDGSSFPGEAFGLPKAAVGEVVFNTAMTGYQEILTDPSYCRQIVTLTCPHIGNTGVNEEDEESSQIHARGLIIRDLPLAASNFRSIGSLDDYLRKAGVAGISEIDTRALTCHLRNEGSLRGIIVSGPESGDWDEARCRREIEQFPGLKGMNLIQEVTTKEPYLLGSQAPLATETENQEPRIPPALHRVVLYDFGVKRSILRHLAQRGCQVMVAPASTPAKEALSANPDGIFLSNGPGDPEPCHEQTEIIRELLETGVPIFGVCLGYQLLALACGASTAKMLYGHHGANHPVRDLRSGKVSISSQNHNFVVSAKGLPEKLEVTHLSLFDGTVQGIAHRDRPALGFQGHPEAGPGPNDLCGLFDSFLRLMESRQPKTQSRGRHPPAANAATAASSSAALSHS